MQLFQRKLPDQCNIYLLGDLHIGSMLTHYHGIEDIKQTILNDPIGYVILMGDLAEAILVDDNKRFDPTTQDLTVLTPGDQYRRFVEIFSPLKDRILFSLAGNHDLKHLRIANFVEEACRELSIPYGTYTSKLTVVGGAKNRLRFKIYVGHGWGHMDSVADDPIRREANMQLRLKKLLQYKAGDCILMAMGHTHKLLVAKPTKELYITDDGKALKQHYTVSIQNSAYIPPYLRWYANTGSFLRNQTLGTSGYAERAGYDPCELGCIKVIVEDQIVDVLKIVL